MVFSFFSRKAALPKPSEANVAGSSQLPTHFQFPTTKQLHTPAPSIDSDAFFNNGKRLSPSRTVDSDSQLPLGPADTPSPPPDDAEQVTDPTALHALIASVPAQTLHTYTLAHLSNAPSSSLPFQSSIDPPSPRTLTILTQFFASLTPPPRLHCVRCHRGFFELENTDRSCTVAHDDDSAIVERVRTGLGTEYETMWGCCEKAVEGDGDMGPPDGWCYEGKHTTDTKRARFRADSTPHEDKLTSCVALRCHEPPVPRRSSTSRKRSRRTMELDDNEDEDRASMLSSHSRSISVSVGSTKGKAKAKAEAEEEEAPAKPRPAKRQRARTTKKQKSDEDKMDVDPPLPPVQPSPKSPCRKSTTTKPPSPTRSRSKPKSTAPITPKPKSTTLQRSPLSASFTPGNADIRPPSPLSQPVTRPESPTRKTRVEVEILTTPGRKGLSTKGSMASLKKRASAGSMNADPNAKLRAGDKPKMLGEIVDTSVDGEVEWT